MFELMLSSHFNDFPLGQLFSVGNMQEIGGLRKQNPSLKQPKSDVQLI